MTDPDDTVHGTISCDEAALSNGGTYTQDPGMTIREHFAALALQGLLANPTAESLGVGRLASNAVALADALINALNAKE